MLGFVSVRGVTIGAISAIIVGVAACGGDEVAPVARSTTEDPRAQPQSQVTTSAPSEITRRVVIGFAHWGSNLGDSLSAMVHPPGPIIVGRVTAADVGRVIFHDAGDHPLADLPPPGHPKANAPTPDPNDPNVGIPWTNYTVQVVRAIRPSGVSVGDSLTVSQEGALIDGVAYELEGDSVILVGHTYLFFLWEARPGIFVSQPITRFEVHTDGRLEPVNEVWANLPAVKFLTGLTPKQAAAKIAAALP